MELRESYAFSFVLLCTIFLLTGGIFCYYGSKIIAENPDLKEFSQAGVGEKIKIGLKGIFLKTDFFKDRFVSFNFKKETPHKDHKEFPAVSGEKIEERKEVKKEEKAERQEIKKEENTQKKVKVAENKEPKISLEELQDKLDDIAERVDILSQEIIELKAKTKKFNKEEKSLSLENHQQDEKDQKTKEEEKEKEKESENQEEKEAKDLDKKPEKETKKKRKGAKISTSDEEKILCEIPDNSTEPCLESIIFNEIAWMGTKDSSNNEWIELKNISENPINLKGWQILDKDKQIKIILPEKIILPGEFYLLERTNDDTLPNIKADFIFTGALSNKDEALYLFDNNCKLQDKVIAQPDWPAGDLEEKRTMERGDDLTWHTFFGEGKENIMGSPKEENSKVPIFDFEIFPKNLSFEIEKTADVFPTSTVVIENRGEEDLAWESLIIYEGNDLDSLDWISLSPDEGIISPSSTFEISLLINKKEFQEESYRAKVRIFPTGYEESFKEIEISLNFKSENKKIIISEIYLEKEGRKNNFFVELYNPNNEDIDLTGWYLQRKTKNASEYSTFVSKNLFKDKIIKAKNYFLIVREGYSKYSDMADILVDNSLSFDNSLLLKNKEKEIVDLVGWGNVKDCESLPAPNPQEQESLSRKWDISEGNYKDSDNNFQDFNAGKPTPKDKNQIIIKKWIFEKTFFFNLNDTPEPEGKANTSGQIELLDNCIFLKGDVSFEENLPSHFPNFVLIATEGEDKEYKRINVDLENFSFSQDGENSFSFSGRIFPQIEPINDGHYEVFALFDENQFFINTDSKINSFFLPLF